MANLSGIYRAARVGADVQAVTSGNARSMANRARNKVVGRFAAGGLMGGTFGPSSFGAPKISPMALGVGAVAGLVPGRRKMVSGLFNVSRSLNDINAAVSANPSTVANRIKNKVVGRLTLKRLYSETRVRGRDTVIRNLLKWQRRTQESIYELSEEYASKMERYAKSNAPWQDQTGAARRGLFGRVRMADKNMMTGIAHSVDYGVHLELKNQGRYAILKPTRDHFAPQYFADVRKMVGMR